MKNLIILFALFAITSCVDKKTKNLEIMKEEVLQFLQDEAFKENYEVNIFEFEAIDYDTINENFLDTLLLGNIAEKMEYFDILVDNNRQLAEIKIDAAKIIRNIDSDLFEIYKKDAQEYVDASKRYIDSLIYFSTIDSTIRKRIEERVEPKLYYRGKFFIKATFKDGEESENILDTTYHFFDTDLKYYNFYNNLY